MFYRVKCVVTFENLLVRALSSLWFMVTKPIKGEYIFITLKKTRVRKHFIPITKVREARERK